MKFLCGDRIFNLFIGLNKYLTVKLGTFSSLSVLTYVLGAQKNRLNETVLLSIQGSNFRFLTTC